MICGCGSQLDRERDTAEIVEFVSVDFERESQRPSYRQDLTRLLEGERARFAEDIHKRQRTSAGACVSHHSLSIGSIVSHMRSV